MECLNFDHSTLIKEYYIPHEFCDEILKEQQSKKILYNQPSYKNIKGYNYIFLHKLSISLHSRYIIELEKFKLQYIEQYPILKDFPNIILESDKNNVPVVHLQKYVPGKFYKVEHCENDTSTLYLSRILVFMTYLNDIEEDGGTHFPYQNFTCKPKKGLTLLWPAYFTHTHRGINAPKEEKYILTGWFRTDKDNRLYR